MQNRIEQEFPQFNKYYDQLDKLARLVEQKSKEINITAIRDYEQIWRKHIFDSLMCSKIPLVESRLEKSKVLDLGTGGGFPGLPLAITHPNSKFVLLDSTRKKLNVVNEFSHFVEAKNVETKWGRSTELIKELGGTFDIVIARGVAFLPELIAICAPFIKPDGLLVFYKQIDKLEGRESRDSLPSSTCSEVEAGEIEAKKHKLFVKEKFEYELDGSKRVILVYSL